MANGVAAPINEAPNISLLQGCEFVSSRRHQWNEGEWTRPPANVAVDGSDLIVTAEEGSDYWRGTGYGFNRDNGHGLLVDWPDDCAVEVSFIADFDQQFDQAGILLWSDSECWTKAAVEFADGVLHVGAVVTRRESDWSMSPCPDWFGSEVTLRASRTASAVTIRAVCGGRSQLLRLAPLDAARYWRAGPLINGPQRPGLTVRFTNFVTTSPDLGIHP